MKNPSKVSFPQKNKGGVAMPKAQPKNVGKGAKTKPAANVAPPIKSTNDITAFRKKKYGV